MPTKSKLKMALAAEKGTDFGKQHLKKVEKLANKTNKAKAARKGGEKKTNGKAIEEEWEDLDEDNENAGPELSDEEGDSDVDMEAPAKVQLRELRGASWL